VRHLSLLQVLSEPDELCQLLQVVPRVEALRMHLRQCHLTQSEVPLLLVELYRLLPQHFVKTKGVLGAVGVRTHLVEVLLTSSFNFCTLSIEVSPDIDQGFLGDPSIFLPRDEGLLPPTQLLCHHHRRCD
jgi:hypothetical protein